jgi:ubiquitin fusion degradation protein 1
MHNAEEKVPNALDLPPGRLFFGFDVVPYVPPATPAEESQEEPTYGGEGRLLSSSSAPTNRKDKAKEKEKKPDTEDKASAYDWGKGTKLSAPTKAPVKPVSTQPRTKPAPSKKRDRSPTPDYGVDDDDVILIDSD